MSRSAGTLVTTHNATYIPPRFMPGYRGHCPALKFDYGETYGNATAKYFQDYRSTVLSSSQSVWCKGGRFPTYYTHDPSSVIGARTRTRDRWLDAPKYRLYNVDHDRNEELKQFDKLAQKHREHFNDKSATVKRVDAFMLPVKAEDQFKQHVPFMILSTRHTDDIFLPDIKNLSNRDPLIKRIVPKSNVRDRAMRDVVFERR
ncbi:UPF0573 protein C2orf70 homolog B [Lingula anatina]|uniref:Ciliary microtubule inner protein 2C n=1 Tax=Lingula anatina TaxID=7574 RepID=A0A1S3J1D1_LINAN|nr:UPF0573 protein C2orf70 homolog B [Lingula anatina]|eukprot:XP_013404250.1 UPF0573 protein C2orf70 homolog B [Lingula anatina]